MLVFENILLCGVCVLSLCLIILSGPVQALLSLIFIFCLACVIFLSLGAEFLALLLLLVYVGALAVLFLFIIMFLNLRVIELLSLLVKYIPVGFFLLVYFVFEVLGFFTLDSWTTFTNFADFSFMHFIEGIFMDLKHQHNSMVVFGHFFYSTLFLYFMLLASILFAALVGAIVLTLDNFSEDKSQETNFVQL